MKHIAEGILMAALLALLPSCLSAASALDYYNRGQEYNKKQNYTAALAQLNMAIKLDPSGSCEGKVETGGAYLARGTVYENLRDLDNAIADYKRTAELHPDGKLGDLARKFLREAERTKRMNEDRQQAEAQRELAGANDLFDTGVSALVRGDFTTAVYNLNRAVEVNGGLAESAKPYLVKAYGQRGKALLQDGDCGKALADLDEALKLSPGLGDIAAARAEAFNCVNDPKPKEKKTPFAALPPPPETRQDHTLEIIISLVMLALTGGVYFFYKKYNPDHVAVNQELGVQMPGVGAESGHPGLGAPDGGQAVLFDKRVRELIDAGDYAKALAAYGAKHPADITPGDKINLFELHLCLGNYDRAGLVYEDIKTYPLLTGNLDLYGRLAELCYGKGQGDLGRRLSRGIFEVIRQTSDLGNNAESYYNLARYCETKGDAALAREIYKLFLDERRDGYQDVLMRYNYLKDQAAPPAPVPARPGHNISRPGAATGIVLADRYQIISEVGTGGMGVVYKGQDKKANKDVAIKRMHSVLKESPGEYERFVGEARIVERLQHPNIVKVHGVVEQDNETYLIFDFVDGRTLSEVLKAKKRLPLEECKRIFKEVCEAVSYAHKTNIIHRDLKPSNIMLSSVGEVKVMDFGLASELRECMTRVTHQTVSGTPAYMAPEQYVGVVKRESDIYAMGVCLYEMLTGGLPFGGHDIEKQKKERNYQAVSAVLPWLPGDTDAVIDRAMDPEPSQRYADAMDFYEALKGL